MTKAGEAIVEGYKAFQRAFHEGDADAIAQMYTEDAELLVPEAPVFTGRLAIAQVWQAIVGSGGNTVHVNIREVQDIGDCAYDIGTFTVTAPDGHVLNAGKYVVIWNRRSSVEWKIHRDIFNWDIPPGKASIES
jgi:uncharacterized protein (TIGR02246 family)